MIFDTSRTDLTETVHDTVNWIKKAQVRVQLQTFVNTVMNIHLKYLSNAERSPLTIWLFTNIESVQ
jgi:general stress protein 26